MLWYHYVGGFFAGMFLGLSSPTTNVLWALLNLVLGYLLFRFSRISLNDGLSLIPFFIGIACISILGAKNFSNKDKL